MTSSGHLGIAFRNGGGRKGSRLRYWEKVGRNEAITEASEHPTRSFGAEMEHQSCPRTRQGGKTLSHSQMTIYQNRGHSCHQKAAKLGSDFFSLGQFSEMDGHCYEPSAINMTGNREKQSLGLEEMCVWECVAGAEPGQSYSYPPSRELRHSPLTATVLPCIVKE